MRATIEQLNKAKYRVAISLLLIAPFMIGQEIEEVVVSGSLNIKLMPHLEQL